MNDADGAAADPPLALEGVRIIEDGGGIAASYAGKLLADLGADVIKIEPPEGDDIRRRGPFPRDLPHRERGGLHLFLNTNKRSIMLDLETAAARRLFRGLVASSDAVITSRPIAEQRRLNLTWDDLARANPELAQVSITMWGIGTRREGWQAASLTASLASGISYRIGDPDRSPLGLPYNAPEFQGGIHGAIAALLGRRAARNGAGGQHVWVSIVDIVSSVMAGAGVAAYLFAGQNRSRAGVRMNSFYPYQVAPAKDGFFEVITLVDDQWNRFMELLGDPDWQHDERLKNRWTAFQWADEIDSLWHPWMKERTKQELWEQFAANRISFQPVHTIAEVAESDQLAQRDFWRDIQTAAVEQTIPGAPYKLGRTPWRIRRPPPLLGADTAEVLSELAAPAAPAAIRRAGIG